MTRALELYRRATEALPGMTAAHLNLGEPPRPAGGKEVEAARAVRAGAGARARPARRALRPRAAAPPARPGGGGPATSRPRPASGRTSRRRGGSSGRSTRSSGTTVAAISAYERALADPTSRWEAARGHRLDPRHGGGPELRDPPRALELAPRGEASARADPRALEDAGGRSGPERRRRARPRSRRGPVPRPPGQQGDAHAPPSAPTAAARSSSTRTRAGIDRRWSLGSIGRPERVAGIPPDPTGRDLTTYSAASLQNSPAALPHESRKSLPRGVATSASPGSLVVLAAFVLYASSRALRVPELRRPGLRHAEPDRRAQGLSQEGARWAFGFHAANWHPLTWLSHYARRAAVRRRAGPDAPRERAACTRSTRGSCSSHSSPSRCASGRAWWWPRSSPRIRCACSAWPGSRGAQGSSSPPRSSSRSCAPTRAHARAGRCRLRGRDRVPRARLHGEAGARDRALRCCCCSTIWPLGRLAQPGRRDGPGARLAREGAAPRDRGGLVHAHRAAHSAPAVRSGSSPRCPGSSACGPPGRACSRYLRASVWPSELAAFYPHPLLTGGEHPRAGPGRRGRGAVASLAACLLRLRAPAVFTGWFWFLGMLVPVLGLVQVGDQAWADRYASPADDRAVPRARVRSRRGPARARRAARRPPRWPAWRRPGRLAVVTVSTLPHWQDSRTLFERALAVTHGNWIADNNLGLVYLERREDGARAEHFRGGHAGASELRAGALQPPGRRWRPTATIRRRSRPTAARSRCGPATPRRSCASRRWHTRRAATTRRSTSSTRPSRANQDRAGLWVGFARLLFDTGDIDRAGNCAASALKLDRSQPEAYVVLAQIALKHGETGGGGPRSWRAPKPLGPPAAETHAVHGPTPQAGRLRLRARALRAGDRMDPDTLSARYNFRPDADEPGVSAMLEGRLIAAARAAVQGRH